MALAVVQSKSASTQGVGNITVTLTSGTTAGNLLVIMVTKSGADQVLTITVSAGTAQSFTAITGCSNTAPCSRAWYVQNCAAGTTAFNVSRPSGTGQWQIVVYEVSGAATSTPLDKTGLNAVTGGSSDATFGTGTTLATTQNDEIAIAFLFASGPADGSQPTLGSITGGYTPETNRTSTAVSPNNNNTGLGAYLILTATGTQTTSCSYIGISPYQNHGGMIATFFAAAGGVDTSKFFNFFPY